MPSTSDHRGANERTSNPSRAMTDTPPRSSVNDTELRDGSTTHGVSTVHDSGAGDGSTVTVSVTVGSGVGSGAGSVVGVVVGVVVGSGVGVESGDEPSEGDEDGDG